MNSINKKVVNKKFELTFELLVKNFSQVESDLKHTIDDFENIGFKFVVEIKPRAISSGVQYMAIHFGYVKVGTTTQYQRRTIRKFFRFSIGIIDRNRNIFNKRCFPYLAMSTYRLMQGWDQFVDRNHLLNPESGLLIENHLKFLCNLEVSDEIETVYSDSMSVANTFKMCYKSLLNDHELSDFTLVVNGKEFPVHRSILAARSPVFRAMITTDMKEKRESKVVLQDFDEELMEQFLHFIYTGSAPKVTKMAQKLSNVADFFDLPDLKLYCAQTLFSELSENNVMEALRFGETYGIQELVLNAIDYIGDNREKVRSKVIQRT